MIWLAFYRSLFVDTAVRSTMIQNSILNKYFIFQFIRKNLAIDQAFLK